MIDKKYFIVFFIKITVKVSRFLRAFESLMNYLGNETRVSITNAAATQDGPQRMEQIWGRSTQGCLWSQKHWTRLLGAGSFVLYLFCF